MNYYEKTAIKHSLDNYCKNVRGKLGGWVRDLQTLIPNHMASPY